MSRRSRRMVDLPLAGAMSAAPQFVYFCQRELLDGCGVVAVTLKRTACSLSHFSTCLESVSSAEGDGFPVGVDALAA